MVYVLKGKREGTRRMRNVIPAQFSEEQRARLGHLGLIEAQIDEVEQLALPIAQSVLEMPPRLQDVRHELLAIGFLNDTGTMLTQLISENIEGETWAATVPGA